MLDLGLHSVFPFMLAALVFHFTRQLLVKKLRGPDADGLDFRLGESLEIMEMQFPWKVLLSPGVRVLYVANRASALAAAYCFVWAVRYLWF